METHRSIYKAGVLVGNEERKSKHSQSYSSVCVLRPALVSCSRPIIDSFMMNEAEIAELVQSMRTLMTYIDHGRAELRRMHTTREKRHPDFNRHLTTLYGSVFTWIGRFNCSLMKLKKQQASIPSDVKDYNPWLDNLTLS